MNEKIAAAEALAELLDDHQLAYDVGASFGCAEAHVIAEFLQAWQSESASRAWLDLHSVGDNEDDDEHHERGAAVRAQIKATGYARPTEGN